MTQLKNLKGCEGIDMYDIINIIMKIMLIVLTVTSVIKNLLVPRLYRRRKHLFKVPQMRGTLPGLLSSNIRESIK